MKYGNKSLWKRLFYSPIGILLALVILFLLIRGGVSIHQKSLIAQIRLDQAQKEFSDLEKQQKSLSASIDQLSTPAGIEAALREKYHAVKQGEEVAVIVDKTVSASGTPTTSDTDGGSDKKTTTNLSWWSRFLSMFGF